MKVEAVIGMFYGDEGKGAVVNLQSTRDTMVVRFSGGAQAGHTVVHEGKRHVFSHFGSGTLKNALTFWSRFCPVNVLNFKREHEALRRIGIVPSIIIDPDCPVTLPIDIWKNDRRAYPEAGSTCGVGVGATTDRQATPYKLTWFEAFNMPRWMLEAKINSIQQESFNMDPWFEALEYTKKSSNCLDWRQATSYSDHIIFEGSQGLLLDKENGIFPHVTNSKTDLTNVRTLLREIIGLFPYDQPPMAALRVHAVSRAYLTKHGTGPANLQPLKAPLQNNENETNRTNPHQGEFKVGRFDPELFAYSEKLLRNFYVVPNYVITCLDQLSPEDLRDFVDVMPRTHTRISHETVIPV